MRATPPAPQPAASPVASPPASSQTTPAAATAPAPAPAGGAPGQGAPLQAKSASAAPAPKKAVSKPAEEVKAPVPERPALPGLTAEESRACEEFGKHLGIHFNDPRLLRLALTHRSYLHVQRGNARESNERLEFLGDSVLGLITSEHLYKMFPGEHEGQLTKPQSLLVSNAILSRRALAMRLGRFALMSN